MFITLTDTTYNVPVRINTDYISAYRHHKAEDDSLSDCTIIHVHDIVYFVSQTPEQIDSLLSECYVMVKSEQK